MKSLSDIPRNARFICYRVVPPLLIVLFVLLLFVMNSGRFLFTTRSRPYARNDEIWNRPLTYEARPRGLYSVNASGTILERLEQFNKAVSAVRRLVVENRRRQPIGSAIYNGSDSWDRSVLGVRSKFIWGANDGYMEDLATNQRHIVTVVLPWNRSGPGSPQANETKPTWNAMTDPSNVLTQTYYRWTGDDRLCKSIEKRGDNNFRYDSMFRQSCSRDIDSGARNRHALEPIYAYNRLITNNFYWPNDGNAYPPQYYTGPPEALFYLHFHQDAFVNDIGDVFSGNTSLAECVCHGLDRPLDASLPKDAHAAPLYDEVFVLSQMYATGVYHRAIEVIPRMVPFIGFLKANPQIRIQSGEKAGGRLGENLEIFGLDPSRLIAGPCRAKVAYQPKGLGCVTPSVQEVQLTAKLYREFIARNISAARRSPPPRNRLILLHRTGFRRFTKHEAIEAAMKSLASEFNLNYTLFSDAQLPTFAETMALFHAAVVVVGSHGAGLSNIIFSQPGTFVVEGLYYTPNVYLCFQRLAHVLGHRYHGIGSTNCCQGRVDVSPDAVAQAVRTYLEVSKHQQQISN